MAKMFEIKGKKATQNAYMAFAAYNRAKALVSEYDGKIDSVDGEKITATFKSNAKAKSFVTAFESEYAEASKAYQAQKTSSSKPTATKGKAKPTTSSTKKTEPKKATPKKSTTSPKKAKGNSKSKLENFVLNNPSCTRAEAVAHGFSGTKSELALLKKSLGVR